MITTMPNNPNATDNLKSYKPGESGNPAGRPKGIKNWSSYVQKVLADDKLCEMAYKRKPGWFEHLEDKNFAYAIIVAMCIKAASGDVKAATWLRKTGYGDKLDITSDERPIIPLMVLDMSPPKSLPKAKRAPVQKGKKRAGNKPKAKPSLQTGQKPKDSKA